MSLRLTTYICLFYQSLIKQKKIKNHLPAVFPIVMYCGETPWDAPLHFKELYHPDIPKSLEKYQISSFFHLFEEKRTIPVHKTSDQQDLMSFLLRFENSYHDKNLTMSLIDELVKYFELNPNFKEIQRSFGIFLYLSRFKFQVINSNLKFKARYTKLYNLSFPYGKTQPLGVYVPFLN